MSSFWRGRKVLVTGAAGFIGSHLCERLLALGADVTAMVHYDSRAQHANLNELPKASFEQLKIVSGDICDPFFVRKVTQGQDTVFHLAALIGIPYSYEAPQSYVRVNIEGTLNVLEAARSEKIRRVVHTSTSETYGSALIKPIQESHPLQGQSPYSASKIGADKMAESYFLSFGLPVTTLRPFNTYGPRQTARAVIPTIVSQLLFSQDNFVELGDTSTTRDFNYVIDTADAFIAVAESEKTLGKVLNSGTGVEISIQDCFTLTQKILGTSKIIKNIGDRKRPQNSEVQALVADAQLLKQLTGWEPKYQLAEGLGEVVKYIQNHRENYRIGKYEI